MCEHPKFFDEPLPESMAVAVVECNAPKNVDEQKKCMGYKGNCFDEACCYVRPASCGCTNILRIINALTLEAKKHGVTLVLEEKSPKS